ncbi:MAG: PQQ-binding-like beta-propeller repeat protein [Planctomycetaceae bacterium]
MRQLSKSHFVGAVLIGMLWGAISGGVTVAADWPTYRGDNARSGASVETVRVPLKPRWIASAPGAPKVSFSNAAERVIEGHVMGNRSKYDDAIHPVVVGQRVFFGSSVDHQLHCVDLITGEEAWTFFSDGPIRLAPTVAEGRVYFGSDDGFAYCLSAADGKLLWKVRGGPANEWLLARGEMVSRWPVRTGVLVDRGVAYFGAGIFPHDDVFLHAVKADDGTLVWKQDNVSSLDAGRNDLSPQGYLLAGDDYLIVPSGRSLPAVFDRASGRMLHKREFGWRSTAGGVVGGVQALLADGQIYSAGPHHLLAMEQKTGDVGFGWFDGRQMVVSGDAAYVATGEVLVRMNRLEYAVNSRRRHQLELDIASFNNQLRAATASPDKAVEVRKKISETQGEMKRIANVGIAWQTKTGDDSALLAAGELLFLGGDGSVTAYSAKTGESVWQSHVSGEARGLLVANGHLLVSTSTGHIYSFASAELKLAVITPAAKPIANPFPDDNLTAIYRQAAEEILKHSGAKRGYGLIVGNEHGRLAFELVKRSELKIYAIEADPVKVADARYHLSRAGLYGTRVVIHQADPANVPYSNYFANVIASDSLVKTGEFVGDPRKLARHLKPLGGAIVLGRPAGAAGKPIDLADAAAWLERTELGDNAELKAADGWATLTRGALPGAGSWSHQYGNAANTAVSLDKRVKGDLGVLWFGDPGPGDMVNRHEGAVGPLATGGRLFVQGEDTIQAYDAYNGTFLWKYENPKALRTGVFQNQNPGNLAASDDRLFHFVKDQLIELDAATGKTKRIHRLPPDKDDGKYEWGYVATENGVLFGTATIRKELEAKLKRRGLKTDDATDGIFAIDIETGKHLWTYNGQSISHHTIAISSENVYFIDSSITPEQRAELLRADKTELAKLTGKELEIAEERAKKADLRRAVALNARTGKLLWANPVDVTDCSDIGIGGGKLTLMYHDNVLILGGANANGHYWKQFVAGEFSRRRLVALSALHGYKLWAKDANYRHRPIVVGNQVIAEPWSFDLASGEQKTRSHPLTGAEEPWSIMRTGHHCGMLTGCESGMLMFRSGATGFYDLNTDSGTRHFAGHRLGCWINAIPAGGLVMIPEASAGCVCLFSIASTIVMEPRETRRPWTIVSAVGAQTPVQSMTLNLGAPGDRKDADGKMWLSYPRHKAYQETSLDVKLDLKPKFKTGGQFTSVGESSQPIDGTETPWLYTSWAEDLEQLTLPLLGPKDQPATYTVRLHFARLGNADRKPIVFDVQLQGKTVVEDLTLPIVPASSAEDADGHATAILRVVENVQVTDNLLVNLVAKQGKARLSAIEVVRNESGR